MFRSKLLADYKRKVECSLKKLREATDSSDDEDENPFFPDFEVSPRMSTMISLIKDTESNLSSCLNGSSALGKIISGLDDDDSDDDSDDDEDDDDDSDDEDKDDDEVSPIMSAMISLIKDTESLKGSSASGKEMTWGNDDDDEDEDEEDKADEDEDEDAEDFKNDVSGDLEKQQTQEQNNLGHVMISYDWDKQDLALKIRDQLKSNNIKVWMDVDDMEGSTLEAMAKAVEQAEIVIMCMSRKYKNSENCRAEAEYAFTTKKRIIPVLLETDYKPDGWLGIIRGSKLWYDFSDDQLINANIGRFLKVVKKFTAK